MAQEPTFEDDSWVAWLSQVIADVQVAKAKIDDWRTDPRAEPVGSAREAKMSELASEMDKAYAGLEDSSGGKITRSIPDLVAQLQPMLTVAAEAEIEDIEETIVARMRESEDARFKRTGNHSKSSFPSVANRFETRTLEHLKNMPNLKASHPSAAPLADNGGEFSICINQFFEAYGIWLSLRWSELADRDEDYDRDAVIKSILHGQSTEDDSQEVIDEVAQTIQSEFESSVVEYEVLENYADLRAMGIDWVDDVRAWLTSDAGAIAHPTLEDARLVGQRMIRHYETMESLEGGFRLLASKDGATTMFKELASKAFQTAFIDINWMWDAGNDILSDSGMSNGEQEFASFERALHQLYANPLRAITDLLLASPFDAINDDTDVLTYQNAITSFNTWYETWKMFESDYFAWDDLHRIDEDTLAEYRALNENTIEA